MKLTNISTKVIQAAVGTKDGAGAYHDVAPKAEVTLPAKQGEYIWCRLPGVDAEFSKPVPARKVEWKLATQVMIMKDGRSMTMAVISE